MGIDLDICTELVSYTALFFWTGDITFFFQAMHPRCSLCNIKMPTTLDIVHHTIEMHPDNQISILWPSYDLEKERVKYKTKHYGVWACDIDQMEDIFIDDQE